eukprot:7278240-Karenia_brevis.AAC.1
MEEADQIKVFLDPSCQDEDDDVISEQDANDNEETQEDEGAQDLPICTDATPGPPDFKALFSLVTPTFMTLASLLSRPVRMSIPATGIDGCTEALHGMNIKFFPLNIADVISGYKNRLVKHYKDAGVDTKKVQFNLGEEGQWATDKSMN